MSKIPTKPIIEAVKACAPKVKELIKQNPDKVIAGLGGVAKVGKEFLNTKEKHTFQKPKKKW